MNVVISKSTLNGDISVPSSKSHTIRAATLATLSSGPCMIRNPLPSDDCLAALRAMGQFGAKTELLEDGSWRITPPVDGLQIPDDVVDVDNSGTSLYFIITMAALLDGYTFITGDASIRKRPATPMLDALTQLGAEAFTSRPNSRSAPLAIKGPLQSGTTNVVGSPSQYISSLLLSAAKCQGKIRIECDHPMELPYIDMTLQWLKRAGIAFEYDEETYHFFEIEGPQAYKPFEFTIPSDWSSVAFPLLAGLTPGSNVIIHDMDFNDVQGDAVVIDHLINMGAGITKDLEHNRLIMKGGNPLKGGMTIDMASIPDALPILSLAAALAEGITVLDNVAGTRLKETDRVEAMSEMLGKMGVHTESEENRMTIYGGSQLKGAVLESYGDHRIAMTAAVAGLYAMGETVILDAECASVTFPGFFEKLQEIGAHINTCNLDNVV